MSALLNQEIGTPDPGSTRGLEQVPHGTTKRGVRHMSHMGKTRPKSKSGVKIAKIRSENRENPVWKKCQIFKKFHRSQFGTESILSCAKRTSMIWNIFKKLLHPKNRFRFPEIWQNVRKTEKWTWSTNFGLGKWFFHETVLTKFRKIWALRFLNFCPWAEISRFSLNKNPVARQLCLEL